jgi:8-oxo-dGTP pyrophosphatase MutT (NUDIX family)
VDVVALLEKFNIPVSQFRRPPTPPPGLVNERPRNELLPVAEPGPDFREDILPESPVANEDGASRGHPLAPLATNSRRVTRLKVGNIACTVAAFGPDGRMLVQRRRDSERWCAPGGGALPGEEPYATAQRELTEETGLTGRNWKFLGTDRDTMRGVSVHCYRCDVDGKPSAARDPDQEASEFAWIDPENPPHDIQWHHQPDFLVARAAPGAQPRHLLREHVELARGGPRMPRGVVAGQATLDDLVDLAAPSVAKLLGEERKELVDLCRDCTSYEQMRSKIRAHFKGSKPDELRALITKAVGLAEQLGRQSVRG